MLEIPSAAHVRRSPLQLAASLAVHAGIIVLLIALPIYFADNSLNLRNLATTYIVAPPPPAAPPPAPERVMKVTPRVIQPTAIVAPQAVPKRVEIVKDQPPPPVDNVAGVIGGIPGGSGNGALDGVLGANGDAPAPPPPAAPKVVRVGGNVNPPEQIAKVDPQYPEIARSARVQGTVVIDAVIDEHGNVVKEHAISGPGLLLNAALQAVEQWKYQPTYLNGQPVSLAMEVSVHFDLGA